MVKKLNYPSLLFTIPESSMIDGMLLFGFPADWDTMPETKEWGDICAGKCECGIACLMVCRIGWWGFGSRSGQEQPALSGCVPAAEKSWEREIKQAGYIGKTSEPIWNFDLSRYGYVHLL